MLLMTSFYLSILFVTPSTASLRGVDSKSIPKTTSRSSRYEPANYPKAIKGMDPVSYLLSDRPFKGKREFSFPYDGKRWYFMSKKHEDLFAQNPKKYVPQYGGYCAYAASQNKIARGDPRVWTVVGGKYYFNFNKSAQKKWLEKRDAYILDADKYWPHLESKLP